MSQHPDNEAAEKYASAIVGKCELQDELAKAHKAGANHVRASLAPELREVREIMEEVRAMGHWGARPCANDKNCVSCSQSSYANEALEILSRLMGKGKSMKDHDLESIASVMREGLPGGQVDRILQLARLGLWAEEHRKAISDGLDAGDRFYYGAPKFKAALAALPAVGAAPGEREKR